MSVIILRDEVVHYEVLGRGRPLVFLHGWVGSWRYWIPAMQAASISFRTYALDFWGFGDTAKNPNYYTISHQIDLLDLFLQEMGIGKIALIGHGLGAVVSLLFTARRPQLVDRVMTVSLPMEIGCLHPRLRTTSPGDLAEWLLGKIPVTEAARAEAPKAELLAIQASLKDLEGINLEMLPGKTGTPCLLVHGQNDPAVQEPQIDQVVKLPENGHAIVFESSGHFPMLDEPNQFNRLMADFLALAPGTSPRQLQLKEEWKRRVR